MKISELISKIRAAVQGAKPVAPKPPLQPLEPLPPLPLPEGLEQALIALRRWYRLVMMTTGLFLLLGAVSGLVRGKGLEGVLGGAAGGAAVGGAAGAVNGAMTTKVSHTYRNFVQRCLKDKGYDVIGWN